MKARTIAVLEDDYEFADNLRRLISSELPPWRVLIAGTMAEGRKLVRDHKVDAIVLDLCLPDCPASISASLIAELSLTAPVLVLTCRDVRNTSLCRECYSHGAVDVWEKTSFHNGGFLFFIHRINSAILYNEANRRCHA